ncbi:MAG TPA: heme-dependent oxidative N-demethylase subunit alpha family protein [Haliangium sp.]|nr:heme-dependent oxidative N-demethylase subunit alpha family protein [Haliangium sp.]
MVAPARYFPVKPGARLQAGLLRLGTDFGNGVLDQRYFHIDDQYEHYVAEKRALDRTGRPCHARHGWLTDTPAQRAAHEVVLAWMRETLAREYPERMPLERPGETYASPYDAIVRNLQEDVAVVQRTPAGAAGTSTDELSMVHVSFPGHWRSDRAVGKSFHAIHEPVPGFADEPAASASMVSAMIDRGPYVRFVWSACADDFLDHHPDHGSRAAWDDTCTEGYLRVERQLTVPFPAVDASVFLIRVLIYPFSSLSPEQRHTLAEAVRTMPEDARRYKGLEKPAAHVIELLTGGRGAG